MQELKLRSEAKVEDEHLEKMKVTEISHINIANRTGPAFNQLFFVVLNGASSLSFDWQ